MLLCHCNIKKAVTRSGKYGSPQRAVGWCKTAAELLSKSPLSLPSMDEKPLKFFIRRTERVLTLQGQALFDVYEWALLYGNVN